MSKSADLEGVPIIGLLGRAHAHTAAPVYEAVAEVAPDIRRAHGNVMEHLDHEDGLRLTDLAAASGLAPQSLQVLVDQLESLGYVERRPDPLDRRAKRIWRTSAARAASEAAARAGRGVEARLEARLGADRYVELIRALREVIETDLGG